VRPLLENPDSNEEHQDLTELFLANGIAMRETASNFLMPATIWVEEADYEKALEIASAVAARHSKRSKEDWEREWRERYRSSYFNWLTATLYGPGILWKLALLTIFATVLVLYPIVYVIRWWIAP